MDSIIEARNLMKSFSLDAGFFARADRKVYAVNDVSLSLERGKTYGLVGESGCGKTTTARLLVGMYRADSGDILFNGESVPKFGRRKMRSYREKVKYVFQDPGRSLNPRMTVGSILTDSYKYSALFPGKRAARDEAAALLEEVGLNPSDLDRRPAEFSGGQRQRISIARGLIMRPEVLICDEIVSALDVSVQGQILNLLLDIKERRSLSFVFIAHDLRVSCYFCDRIGVMYAGVLLEEASSADLYRTALHPYTRLLFGIDSGNGAGEVRAVTESPRGCPFAHRCPAATSECRESLPEWREAGEGHRIRCFNCGG